MHHPQQAFPLAPGVEPIGPHMAQGAYGAFGFGPQYQDWVQGSRERKRVAECPPAIRSQITQLRERWEAGKHRWKSMSGKEKRASRDQGATGLWAQAQNWKADAERLLAKCEADAAAIDAGMGTEQDVAALAMQTQQLQTALSQPPPGAGTGIQTAGIPRAAYLVPAGVAVVAAIGLGAYLLLR